jgi:hypothetical protein
MLYLGRPQDRTGSPILGDFEAPVPPKFGGLGGQNAVCKRSSERCVYTVASNWGRGGKFTFATGLLTPMLPEFTPNGIHGTIAPYQ